MGENDRLTWQLVWQEQWSESITALVHSPTGIGWAAATADGSVIWNPGTDRWRRLRPAQSQILQAASGQSIDRLNFSADGVWLSAGGASGEVLIWNCEGEGVSPQFERKIDGERWIDSTIWHPTQPYLAFGRGSQVELWDIPKSERIATWKFNKSSIFDLAWHPSGECLAVAGYKGVRLLTPVGDDPGDRIEVDTASIEVDTASIEVDTASIKVAWSPDGRYLAAANLDRSLTIIDCAAPQDPWILQGCPGKIRQLLWVYHSANPCLAVASGTAIVLWEFDSQTAAWTGCLLEGHQDNVLSLAAHPHLPLLASGGGDGCACLWSVSGEVERVFTDSVSQIDALDWHPSGRQLAWGDRVGSIQVWAIPA